MMTFYSAFPETTLKCATNIGAILGIGMLLTMQYNWYDKCLKYLLLFSMVHVLFTFFSYIFPDIFINIVLPLLPGEISRESSLFMRNNFYAGITDQTGRNAFYITVGISIMVTALIAKTKKVSIGSIFTLTLMVIALLLTGKRGHMVANIISILAIIVVYAKVQRKNIVKKLLFSIIAISFLVIVIIMIVPEAATPFIRFMVDGGRDITSGRINLYVFAIELFKQKPVWGWGFGSFFVFQDKGTHNVYLQLLCETGVVGTVLFVSILLLNILVTLKSIRRYYSSNKIKQEEFLLFSLYMQVFYITYAMTGNPLTDGFILIIYLIAMSIPYAMSLSKDSSKCLNNYNSLIDHK
jgi:O-antigen ligase